MSLVCEWVYGVLLMVVGWMVGFVGFLWVIAIQVPWLCVFWCRGVVIVCYPCVICGLFRCLCCQFVVSCGCGLPVWCGLPDVGLFCCYYCWFSLFAVWIGGLVLILWFCGWLVFELRGFVV